MKFRNAGAMLGARAKRVPENPATIAHTTVSLVRKGSCLEPRCCARAGTSWLSRKTHKFLNKRILVLACLLACLCTKPIGRDFKCTLEVDRVDL